MKAMLMVDDETTALIKKAFQNIFEEAVFGNVKISPHIKEHMYMCLIELAIEEVGKAIGPLIMNKDLLYKHLRDIDPLYKYDNTEM